LEGCKKPEPRGNVSLTAILAVMMIKLNQNQIRPLDHNDSKGNWTQVRLQRFRKNLKLLISGWVLFHFAEILSETKPPPKAGSEIGKTIDLPIEA
jgi:hypothetical protein